jgi:hypothetical protein
MYVRVYIYIYIYLKEVIEEGVVTKLGVLGVNQILRGFEEDLCHIHRVLVMRYHLAVLPQYVHLYIPTTTIATMKGLLKHHSSSLKAL